MAHTLRFRFRSACCWAAFAASALLASPAAAQDFIGFPSANSAGVFGLDLNPAVAADSRYRLDIGLGMGFSVSNDYMALERSKLGNFSSFNADSYQDLVQEDLNAGNRSFFANVNVNLGAMLTLSERAGIGLTLRSRAIGTATELEGRSARFVLAGFDAPELFGEFVRNDKANIRLHFFQEAGLTYARVLLDEGRHFLKGGIRAKLLLGTNSFYAQGDNLEYRFPNADTLDLRSNSNFQYGYTNDFEFGRGLSNVFDGNVRANPTLGGDIGFVYEFRPRYRDYTRSLNGERNVPARDENKYLLRAGLSLTDLGRVTFSNKGSAYRLRVPEGNLFENPLNPVSDIYRWNIEPLDNQLLSTVDAAMRDSFLTEQRFSEYSVGLPTRLNLTVDYRIGRKFYVNAIGSFSLADARKSTATIGQYGLAPRYESRVFDITVPLWVNNLGQFNSGFTTRIGPVIIGSNSILTLAFQNKTYNLDLFFGVRVPLRYGTPGDKDEDGVSNAQDECPTTPGTWEFKGCPDSDGDHIPDKQDRCPDEPGLPQFFGCPDSDGDGIPDKDDQSPFGTQPSDEEED